MKKIPQRTCIGCNSKKDMIERSAQINKTRTAFKLKNKDGEISIDKTGRANGRGAYICDCIDCLEKAIKSKRLEKSFEMKIEDEIFEKLRGVMSDR